MNTPLFGEPKFRDQSTEPLSASSAYRLPSPPPTNSTETGFPEILIVRTSAVLATPRWGGAQFRLVSSPR